MVNDNRKHRLATFLLALYCMSSLQAGRAADTTAPAREWPYDVPRDVVVPEAQADPWVRNPIDAFILERLAAKRLRPASEATRRQLVRRLYLDLIGLPPSPTEVDQFVADNSDDAYEKLVDRLLGDPRYGERWARLWLDLARYADTAGYEGDPDLPHISLFPTPGATATT